MNPEDYAKRAVYRKSVDCHTFCKVFNLFILIEKQRGCVDQSPDTGVIGQMHLRNTELYGWKALPNNSDLHFFRNRANQGAWSFSSFISTRTAQLFYHPWSQSKKEPDAALLHACSVGRLRTTTARMERVLFIYFPKLYAASHRHSGQLTIGSKTVKRETTWPWFLSSSYSPSLWGTIICKNVRGYLISTWLK